MPGLFVTGTDTGVGKTVLAAAIIASLRDRGIAVRALKPLITGLDDPPDPDWPPDHELLAGAAGCSADDVGLVRFGPAVSPHLAAELAGTPIEPERLVARIRASAGDEETLIVEGVGGLLVPIADTYDVRRLAQDLGYPMVVAARPGLGTINHTLLTLDAARGASLEVASVVLTPWPADPTEIERSNRATIERIGGVAVETLEPIARADPTLLARAGARLPVDRWLRG